MDSAIPPATAARPWLVADIGGTNARFGLVTAPGCPVVHVQRLTVADHAGPESAIRAYLGRLAGSGVAVTGLSAAALAVATPVTEDEIRFTNSAWRFSVQGLQAALDLARLRVLNDFEALALSLPRLGPSQRHTPAGWPVPGDDPRQTLAVVGPGTGLGVGGALHTVAGWAAIAGEGGHVTLAASDDTEAALLAWVRQRHGHVSAERLLSGMGLPLLHQAVAAVKGPAAPPLSAEQIVAGGLGDVSDPVCRETLSHFCAMLGGVAGNVVLTLGARGGLYIGGGIVPRLGAFFAGSRFRERMVAKGRFADYLAAVPVAVITDTLAALAGGALALEQECLRAGQHA